MDFQVLGILLFGGVCAAIGAGFMQQHSMSKAEKERNRRAWHEKEKLRLAEQDRLREETERRIRKEAADRAARKAKR